MSKRKAKGGGKTVLLPPTGSLWYGNQESLNLFTGAALKLDSMSLLELSDMQVRAPELLATIGSSKNQFENHYMVDTYADGKIAVISVAGVLMHHPLPLRAFGLNVTTYGEIQAAVDQALRDEKVEKIVMAYSSHGGNGNGLFRTSNFLEKATKLKEFTTFTDSVMGSAAYWLGVNSPRIVTEPLAELGSIGVYITLTSYAQMNENSGIDVKVVRAGEFKALGHQDEPITDKVVAEVQRTVSATYDAFLDHASEKRGQNKESFRVNAAEGRTFFGNEAVKVGLADEVMVFDEMIEAMMSAKSKSVPVSGSGRTKLMNEGTMNKKMLKLLQDAGIQLSAEQQSQLASGASFADIGLSAELAAQLDAAAAEGDDEGEGEGKGAKLDANKDDGKKDDTTQVDPAGDKSLEGMMTKLLDLQSQVTTLQTKETASLAKIAELDKELKDRDAQIELLKPLVAEGTNRMNVALRKGEQENLASLATADLVKAYSDVKEKFMATFPVGKKSISATTKDLAGEARPLPDTLAAAAKDATNI